MKQIVIAGVVAAVAMFVWGFVFWVVWTYPYSVLKSAPDEAALGQALVDQLPEGGAYLLPGMKPGRTQEDIQKAQAQGPIALVLLVRGGVDAGPKLFLNGFAHMLVSALILATMLRIALPLPGGYSERFEVASLAGLAGAVFSNLGKPIWWHHPWDAWLLFFAYDLSSWLIAAAISAYFIKET